MLRISKLTDYALVILAEMQEDKVMSATCISEKTQIPLATTNKVLKKLSQKNICLSKSGKMGGFVLSTSKQKISLLSVVHAIEESQTSLTQCSNNQICCQLKKSCKISDKMNIIDKEINLILSNRFISDLL